MERHNTLAPRKFVPPVDFTTSQAAAVAAATPAPAAAADGSKTRQPINPHVRPDQDWVNVVYEEAPIEESFEKTVDAIILAGNDYSVLTRLQSGTIRQDRRQVSPAELEQMERDKLRRQNNYYESIGSSQSGSEIGPTSPSTQTKG
jgi:hypothetical protein